MVNQRTESMIEGIASVLAYAALVSVGFTVGPLAARGDATVDLGHALRTLSDDQSIPADERIQRASALPARYKCQQAERVTKLAVSFVQFRTGADMWRKSPTVSSGAARRLETGAGVSEEGLTELLSQLAENKCNSDKRLQDTLLSLASFLCNPQDGNAQKQLKGDITGSSMVCCCARALAGPKDFPGLLNTLGVPPGSSPYQGCEYHGVSRCPDEPNGK